MPDAYVEEALERAVPVLDPNISPAALEAHICGLILRLVKLGAEMACGPREDAQIIALDDLSDALTEAFHLEQARRIPPAEREG